MLVAAEVTNAAHVLRALEGLDEANPVAMGAGKGIPFSRAGIGACDDSISLRLSHLLGVELVDHDR